MATDPASHNSNVINEKGRFCDISGGFGSAGAAIWVRGESDSGRIFSEMWRLAFQWHNDCWRRGKADDAFG
jgi:hypothetical protein